MLLTTNERQLKYETIMIEELVPKDHLLRKIDKHIDFSFINEICRPYYCEDNGRPAIEPEIMFVSFGVDTQNRIDAFIDNLIILAALKYNSVKENDGINRFERAVLPFVHLGKNFICYFESE